MVAEQKRFLREYAGEGLQILRDAQDHGGIDATTLVKLLEMRRELLTSRWGLPIWQELGGCYIQCEQKLLRQVTLLSMPIGHSLKTRGIYFPRIDTGSNIQWCGLLRPRIRNEEEIIEEASWCMVTYAPEALSILNPVSAADVVEFYGRAFDVLRWLKDAVEKARDSLVETVDRLREIEDLFLGQEWVYTDPILNLEMRARHPEIDFK